MSTCWDCHWGWPEPVALIYKEALEKLDGYDSPLHFGPAHIVWADENFDAAEWCLENFDKYKGDYSDSEHEIVRWSLEQLAKIPASVYDVCPVDYDDIDPREYPPPVGVKMIHPREIRQELKEKRGIARGFIVVGAE